MKFQQAILALLFIFVPIAAKSELVDLSSRTFWVGEELMVPNEVNSRIYLSGVNWAAPLLDVDPVLSGSLVSIYRRYYTVREYVSTYSYEILSENQIPDWAKQPRFEIRGIPDHPDHLITYISMEPRGRFHVKCSGSRLDETPRFTQCFMMASYGPDPNIALQARIFFPPNPADKPEFFNAVADRLVEIATCLDVTSYAAFKPVDQEGLWPCGLTAIN